MYKSELFFDEDGDIFADELAVVQEIGGTEFNPQFVVRHIIASPSEAEMKKYRRRANTSRLKADKRGRQKLVTQSNIGTAMQFYAKHLIRLEGALFGGEKFTVEQRAEFIAAVDPLIQKTVFNRVMGEFSEALSD